MSQNIEIRSDGGDFVELWVNGVRVLDVCSDDYEVGGIIDTAKAIATALDIDYTESNDFEWVEELGLVTPEEAEAYYNEDEEEDETPDEDKDAEVQV